MSIKTSFTNTVGNSTLRIKKNSPHIFFAVGLVGVVGSTVLACRATLKLEAVVDEIRGEFGQIQRRHEAKMMDESDYRNELMVAYVHGAQKMVKLYGPSAIVGGLSLAALTGSHIQLSQRNAALTAALTAVSNAYNEYRNRVRETIGEKKELAIYQGCLEDSDELESAEKTGKVVNHASPYGRFFEPNNINWVNNMESNQYYIQCQQNWANDRLQSRGHIFLNELYDNLGFDATPAGAVVGWVKTKAQGGPGDGDGFVDVGLFVPQNIDFINGNARGCWLDFNVDGVVFELI